jgi:hypothetical protein
LLVIFLCACTAQKQTISPQVQILDVPPIGEERGSELGEALVQKGQVFTYDAMRLENRVTAGDGVLLKRLTLEPGILKATMRDKKRIYYSSANLVVYDAMLGTQMQLGGLAVSLTNEKDIRFHMNGSAVMRPKPEPILTKTQVADTDRPSFRKELIYNGRTGNAVKFVYREQTSDVLRAPFSQDVQLDLSEGQTIAFKGVRIEIIEATNTKIRYRVLSSFPDAN